MTESRSQDFLLGALVASVAVHAALMFLIKPQVMTHVTGEWARRAQRGPIKVVEAPPERPKPIAMSSVEDVEAVRDAPAAEADALFPPAPERFAPQDEALAPEAAPPPPPEPSDSALFLAPELSEVMHVEEGVSQVKMPAPDASRMPPPQAVAAPGPSSAPEASDAARLAVEAPAFVVPDAPPALPDDRLAEAAGLERPDERPPVRDAYVPEREVLDKVDERVVEEEKAAVRDLMDVRRAEELAGEVDVSADSAQAGEWTYFRVRLKARADLAPVPKDVVVLLDASGSIGDDRLKSCREAAQKILRSCANTGDRFNLVAFRDRFSYAFRTWQACDKEGFAKADKWLGSLASYGRTDVFAVIRSVLTLPRDPARPLIALVVTDGDANAGVKETAQILSKFTALNDGLISVYMYGVKGSANRELIDVLTRGNRGESFIYGGARWRAGEGIEALSERFRDPVLTDLRMVFAADTKAEAYPRRLRNLYRGDELDVVGRVPAGTREVAFSLKGLNGPRPYEGYFKVSLSGAKFDQGLPAAWNSEFAIDEKLR